MVHAYGPLRVIEDSDWLLEHLNRLTDQHEAASSRPWKVSDAPEDWVRNLTRAIVGLELPILRLEGKWKASQNRASADRQAVAAALQQLGTPRSLAMQAMVEERGPI